MLRLIGNDAIARRTAIKAVFIRRGGADYRPAIELGMATACGVKATFTQGDGITLWQQLFRAPNNAGWLSVTRR
ncbi:hypothetical protein SLY17_000597 [Cronobacter dublinensis]|nr:hypothetical protein [Cronobacter dublinensis]